MFDHLALRADASVLRRSGGLRDHEAIIGGGTDAPQCTAWIDDRRILGERTTQPLDTRGRSGGLQAWPVPRFDVASQWVQVRPPRPRLTKQRPGMVSRSSRLTPELKEWLSHMDTWTTRPGRRRDNFRAPALRSVRARASKRRLNRPVRTFDRADPPNQGGGHRGSSRLDGDCWPCVDRISSSRRGPQGYEGVERASLPPARRIRD